MAWIVSTNSIAQPTFLIDPATGEPASFSISGTVAVTQSGAWNITNITGTISLPTGAATAARQDTGNASLASIDTKLSGPFAVTGTFFQATQPISAATLPLPAGASTAAKQPALGTAGSPSADVITVQGVASGTPQPVGGDVASAAADSGNPLKIGAVYTAVATPTVSGGQRINLQATEHGALRTYIVGKVTTGADGLATDIIRTGRDDTDADTGTGWLGVATYVFNGTTMDRMRGDTKGIYTREGGYSFANINTATTTTVKSGAGVLHTLTVNNLGTVASITTVYDSTTGSGTKIATINTLAGQTSYIYDVSFATGLTIVTTGTVAPDITVSYR